MSKLLSQGSFGCVYYPSLNCQGKSEVSKEYLSKLQKKDFNSENEKNIGKKIIANILEKFLTQAAYVMASIHL